MPSLIISFRFQGFLLLTVIVTLFTVKLVAAGERTRAAALIIAAARAGAVVAAVEIAGRKLAGEFGFGALPAFMAVTAIIVYSWLARSSLEQSTGSSS